MHTPPRLACLLIACAWASPSHATSWVDARTPHFRVVCDDGERSATRVAVQFERVRWAFGRLLPNARTDPGVPVVVFAARDEASLRRILPEFWEHDGEARPAGLFLPGRDTHYVAVRTDVNDADPLARNRYQVIFHEYAHLLFRLNFERMPLWLSEGLAEFYSATEVREDEIRHGRPIAMHLATLRQRLRPLDEILEAEPSDALPADLFYAESWALVHYLFLGTERGEGATRVWDLLGRLGRGEDAREATRAVFPDTAALDKALARYVRSFKMRFLRFGISEAERQVPTTVREIPSAFALAAGADYHPQRGNLDAARDALAAARDEAPDAPGVHRGLGSIALHEGRWDEARAELARAVHDDPTDVVARLRQARLISEHFSDDPAALDAAKQGLLDAVRADPGFAPAYVELGRIVGYAGRGSVSEALSWIRRGLDLEPGSVWYRLAAGEMLARLGDLEPARRAGEAAVRLADSESERRAARRFLDSLDAARPLPADPGEARHALEALCALGRASHCHQLAEALLSEPDPDPVRVTALLVRACEAGDTSACVRVARELDEGGSLVPDPALAVRMYQRACEAGPVEACVRLALLVDAGRGTPADPARAVGLLEPACAGGHDGGCVALALLLESGRGTPRDVPRAAGLYDAVCEHGDPLACRRLARLLDEGRDVRRDRVRAEALFRRACDAARPASCTEAALSLLSTRPQGHPLIAELLGVACEAGDGRGCSHLAQLHEFGIRVDRDRTRAVALYARACQTGYSPACARALALESP